MASEPEQKPAERESDPLAEVIQNWPDQFAGTLRMVLERLHKGEINEGEAKSQLVGELDAALRTISGRERPEEEEVEAGK